MTDDLPLIKVIWLDSSTRSGWHFPDSQEYDELKVTSVGFLIAESETSITVAGSAVFGKDYQVSDTMTIPRCCIISQKELNKR